MAISKIKPHYVIEGRSIATVLTGRIGYDKNPEKTDCGLLATGYRYSLDTTWQEFVVSKQIYTTTTRRRRAPGKDVTSRLLMQSFKPGTITSEDVNKLGYKIAMELTRDGHRFIAATRIDKHYIHNVHPDRAMRKTA